MQNRRILLNSANGIADSLIKFSLKLKDSCTEHQCLLFLVYAYPYHYSDKDSIIDRIRQQNSYFSKNIRLKNWFEFMLEDMTRPYASDIKFRIRQVYFPGEDLMEKPENYNETYSNGMFPDYYFSNEALKYKHASEVAVKVCLKNSRNRIKNPDKYQSDNPVIDRIASIYPIIAINGVDGFDSRDLLALDCILSNPKIKVICGGNFTANDSQTARKLRWFKRQSFEIIDDPSEFDINFSNN